PLTLLSSAPPSMADLMSTAMTTAMQYPTTMKPNDGLPIWVIIIIVVFGVCVAILVIAFIVKQCTKKDKKGMEPVKTEEA
ncbi:hypothetical protein, partial [Salmonella sp. s55004]|uniref:hypothetical protein n=1 Tax=Salmonella sp. s55004 TaxID=3159675 RepID=UPI00398079D0